MDNELRGQIKTMRPTSFTSFQPIRKTGYALVQQATACGSVNRTINTAAATHPSVGGIDDSIDSLSGDIALNCL